ncbi:MAG: peptidylprolyl isomerase, partial [Verrucomicrobiales bacterium]
AELKAAIEGERGGTIVERIFSLDPEGSLEERVSDVFRTDVGYFIVRLDESEPAQELSYEEAKEQATQDLKIELATTAMREDAAKKREALVKALDEGKSLEDAAKELDLSVSEIPEVSAMNAQFGMVPPSFELAHRLNPGEVSELSALPSEENPLSMMMVQLIERKISEDPMYQTRLDQVYRNQEETYEILAFQNWLNERYIENNVRVAESQ